MNLRVYEIRAVLLWLLIVVVAATTFLNRFVNFQIFCELKPTFKKSFSYNRESSLIFVDGIPSSGTTLMRAMLDAHPDVRCGPETSLIQSILKEGEHFKEVGVTKEILDNAIASMCLEIITNHGEPAPRLCNKDPFTMKMASYVIELFPNAKFLFMIRDGRATVHSIISRKVIITGFDCKSFRKCLKAWNSAISAMLIECAHIGKQRCMMVYYEQLVLNPDFWMKKILEFLDLPWNESVLHHENFINKTLNGVRLSKYEKTTKQVEMPINTESLSKWTDDIPEDVKNDVDKIAPMLRFLGYDPLANPPDYAKMNFSAGREK